MPAFNWVASRQQQQRAGVRAGAGATSSTAPAPARSKRRSLDLVSLSYYWEEWYVSRPCKDAAAR